MTRRDEIEAYPGLALLRLVLMDGAKLIDYPLAVPMDADKQSRLHGQRQQRDREVRQSLAVSLVLTDLGSIPRSNKLNIIHRVVSSMHAILSILSIIA